MPKENVSRDGIFYSPNEMEAYTSNLSLLTDSLICPHNALLSHLKLVPLSQALYFKKKIRTRFVMDYTTKDFHPLPLSLPSKALVAAGSSTIKFVWNSAEQNN